jgi:pimeloyl-ACP methyl ester carboxylesterase
MVACPAHVLGTTAPVPMRLMSLGVLGRLMLRLQPPSRRQTERVFAGVHEDFSATPELVDVLLACERLPWYPDALLSLMRAVMRVGRARPEVVSGAVELGRVPHPVQLVWGRRDPFGSVDVARRTAELLPDAELHVVRGGHAPWFDDPVGVGDLVRTFVGRHAPLPGPVRPRPHRS